MCDRHGEHAGYAANYLRQDVSSGQNSQPGQNPQKTLTDGFTVRLWQPTSKSEWEKEANRAHIGLSVRVNMLIGMRRRKSGKQWPGNCKYPANDR